MYDTTSTTIVARSVTGPNVGPSTYVICNPRCQKQNCAPFLSTGEQHPPISPKLATDALYDIRYQRNKILGGASPKNKAPRFVYKSDTNPGPADYDAKPIRCLKKKLKFDPTKPKLFTCRVPYSTAVVAPSIPTRLNENGYEIGADGNIIKIPPFEPVPIPIDIKSQFCSKKGFKWSSSTFERFNWNQCASYGPGPAAYTLKITRSRRADEDERFREMARKSTFLPRYVELQEIKAAKENKPGPGAYNVGIIHCRRKKPKRPPPFITGAERFSAIPCNSSAHNGQSVCNCSRDKKYFSVKCVPFGVQASRFKKGNGIQTPGPGDYEIKGPLQEKIEKKKNPHAVCDPPFNSTIPRDISFVPKDAYFTPSSADYPEDKENEKTKKTEISSAVFTNNVCRFFSPSDKKDYIGPAKYEDSKSFQKNRDRKTFTVSEVPFNTSGIRSTTPAVKFDVPCPTTYKSEQTLGCKSFSFATSRRFPCAVETPGPGLYNIHPREGTSTYQAFDTHNLRLKENVLHKKLRQAPRETRKRWLKTLKQRKLLKWFDVELDFEQRMMILIQQVFDKPV